MAVEWPAVEFGRILEGTTRNGIYKPREYHGSGCKMVNMGELFAYPRLRAVPMRRVELTENEINRTALHPGDLLFARRSLVAEGAGRCSIVLEVDEPTTYESSIVRARPDSTKADGLFLYYFFSSSTGRHLLDTIRRQVAVAGITGSDLASLRIPLPPVPEQRAIAHILGALDDKIELNRRMNATLEAIARALFKSWFVDFDPVRAKAEVRDPGLPPEVAALFPDSFQDSKLGEIPRGWRVSMMGDLANINARTLGRNDSLDVVDYIEISEVMRGDIVTVARYRRGEEPSRARRRLQHGDTVLSTVRPDRGAYFLCIGPPESLIASTGFAVLTPTGANWAFVYAAATRPEVGQELGRLADGGAYPAVRPEVVAARVAVVPDEARLLSKFDEIAQPLFLRAASSRRESGALASIRDALLPMLLSGRLRVKDADRLVETAV